MKRSTWKSNMKIFEWLKRLDPSSVYCSAMLAKDFEINCGFEPCWDPYCISGIGKMPGTLIITGIDVAESIGKKYVPLARRRHIISGKSRFKREVRILEKEGI